MGSSLAGGLPVGDKNEVSMPSHHSFTEEIGIIVSSWERSSHNGIVILGRHMRLAVVIPRDAVLIAFPAENRMISEPIALRGSPQLVALIEDEDSHQSEV